MDLLTDVLSNRTQALMLAHASEECNRYELIEKHVGACLGTLGRGDLRTLVARQDASLPTVWIDTPDDHSEAGV